MKTFLTTIALGFSLVGLSQDNSIKLNWTQMTPLGGFGVNYERKITDNFSINARVNLLLPRSMPFQNMVNDGVSADGFDFTNDYSKLKLSSIGFHPQFKFYPGGEALNGFYVAGLLGFQRSGISTFSYGLTNPEFPTDPLKNVKGDVKISDNFFGGGIGIGNQWVTNSGFTFDIMWIGLGVGKNTLGIKATTSVKGVTRTASDEFNDFIEDESTSSSMYKNVSTTYDETSLTIKMKNLMPYTRILNFSIGYSF